MSKPPRILSIAGSDSGGGAGIQADIKTITMLGGHAMTAVTSITAQNSQGVSAVHPVPTQMVLDQIDAVLSDFGADAIKIGMIGSANTADSVADILSERVHGVPVIFDPVMIATSGAVLADDDTIAAFGKLMDIAALTTPNLPELEKLGGVEKILSHGTAVLVKGGHARDDTLVDTLYDEAGETKWSDPRIDTPHTHGTGCTLSSAIATGLGGNLTMQDAIGRARDYVRRAISNAPDYVKSNGPLAHHLGQNPYDLLLDGGGK